MNASFDAEVSTLRHAAATATDTRHLAQERIVAAFRQQLQGEGPGPSDADLQSFARLVLVENALLKELGAAVVLAASRPLSDGARDRRAHGDEQSLPR
ncbi:hypothetical protein AB4Z46_14565 [Variovorax sp. M-6]|uniref:hypothetical protein n=1 Tax=Variovorax sp. M-6 TaxID=3233041 RepID=UPI003F958BBB